MGTIGKRYERHATLKPCSLDRRGLLELAALVQKSYTRAEVERYFRVSTTLGGSRIFADSLDELFTHPDLPPRLHNLSFWMEGWDQTSRFDKTVLLDFSKSSIQLQVEGSDPVWVFDKFADLNRFLEKKTSWFWPIIQLEKLLLFVITLILICNVIISIQMRRPLYQMDNLSLLAIWIVFVSFDVRDIWPYSLIWTRKVNTAITRENLFMLLMVVAVLLSVVQGSVLPLLKQH